MSKIAIIDCNKTHILKLVYPQHKIMYYIISELPNVLLGIPIR